MRILSVTPYYSPEGGGLERYAHAILSRLAARGHDVRALAFTRNGSSDADIDGVHVARRRAPRHLGNTPIDLAFGARVEAAMRASRPDVVVAHTPVPFPAEMAYLAARRAGLPFVTTYHAGKLLGSSGALAGLAALDRATLQRWMLAGSARLIAVGPYVRDHALARHRGKVTIIAPGVDTARFHPDGEADGRSILFVGPLSSSYRWKGVDVLWEAFRLVRKRVPAARLTLVGDGDRMAELTAKARDTGAVRLAGRLSDDALVDEYRRAAVVVLPSTSAAESFGMVLAEANACGRPVVASRVGGIPDFVQDGDNGLLARPGDPQDLADKLLALLVDPDRAARMGAAGRRRVERFHDWADLADATDEVLTSVVEAAPKAR